MIQQLTDNRVWLAPMAGVTDFAYRAVCKRMGAQVLVTEMVSADGLLFNPEPSLSYAVFDDAQRPIGVQLFGSEPDIMARAIDVILPLRPDFVDVNMGCPVKKVINRGAGSALMREPERAVAIVRQMKRALAGTALPLSVKFRAGWDAQHVNAVDFGRRMEDAGADILCLHARTRSQMYGGAADWDLIARLVDAVHTPVVGNGDIRETDDVERMRAHTGCNSVAIGRGAMGRPWLFTEIEQNRLTGRQPAIACKTRVECIREHYRLAVADKGEGVALREMRAHLAWYTKGLRGGAAVRRFVNGCTEPQAVLDAIEKLYTENDAEDSGAFV